MSSAASGPAASHLAGVDILRAFACLWVVLYHTGVWWLGANQYGFAALQAATTSLPSWLLIWLTRLGFHGVGLFLVLSGFCLYYPLVRRSGVRGASVEWVPYAKRRASRILPAYYASMIVITALASWSVTAGVVFQPITFLDWATHLALVHNLYPPTLWTMNGAYWSLGLEAQLYILFPFLVVLARRWGVQAVLLLGFSCSLLWLGVLHWAQSQGFSTEQYVVLHEALPARLADFSAGMGAAAIVGEGRVVSRRWLLLLAALWIPASHIVQVRGGVSLPWDRPFNAIAFASLLILFSRFPERLLSLLLARVFTWIGAISYSLYLVHQPLLLVLRTKVWNFHMPLWILVWSGVGISLLVGWIFYEISEAPAQRWFARRKKTLRRGEGSST